MAIESVDDIIAEYVLKDSFSAAADKIIAKAEKAAEKLAKMHKTLATFNSMPPMKPPGEGVYQRLEAIEQGFLSAGKSVFTLLNPMGLLRGVVGIASSVLSGLFSILGAGVSVIVEAGAALLKFTATVAGVATAGLIAFTKSSIESALGMDQMKRGLLAVEGSAQGVTDRMRDLREVAKLPGLGVKEAVESFIRLKAAGLSAEGALRTLKGFGNALATVGKGKADLEGVILAVTQIAAKTHISAQDINQISERVPQMRRLMSAAFGTADTEKLGKMGVGPGEFFQGIITQLEKLPAVLGGPANDIENLTDAWEKMKVAFGTPFLPVVSSLTALISPFMDFLSDSGIMAGVAQKFVDMLDTFAGGKGNGVLRFFAVMVATLEQIPSLLQRVAAYLVQVGPSIAETVLTAFNTVGRVLTGVANIVIGLIKPLIPWVGGIVLAAYDLTHMLDMQSAAGFARRQEFQKAVGQAGAAGMKVNPLPTWHDQTASSLQNGINNALKQSGLADVGAAIGNRADEIMGQYNQTKGKASAGLKVNTAAPIMADSPAATALQNIEKHTRQTARNTDKDYQRQMFGGGDQSLITREEIAGARGGGGSGSIPMMVPASKGGLDQYLADFFNQNLTAAVASGHIRIARSR